MYSKFTIEKRKNDGSVKKETTAMTILYDTHNMTAKIFQK